MRKQAPVVIDDWIRSTGGQDTSGINDSDWKLIEELRQALYLVWTGKASDDFHTRVQQRLHDSTDSKETRQIFRKMFEEDLRS